MAVFSNMIPFVSHTLITGFWNGVMVRAQQSNGRGRVEAVLVRAPLRSLELRRCSEDD